MRQLLQIRRNIKTLRGAPVYAAYAASGKHTYARQRGDTHGGCHGGRTIGACGHYKTHVATANLGHRMPRAAQTLYLRYRQTRLQSPLHDSHRGRHRAVGAHLGLDL